MAKQLLEKQIQSAILDLLRFSGYYVWKQSNIAVRASYKNRFGQESNRFIPSTMPGISDITGIGPGGVFLAVEVKRKGGKLSDLQKDFLDKVKEKGGLAYVVYSVDEMVDIIKSWPKK